MTSQLDQIQAEQKRQGEVLDQILEALRAPLDFSSEEMRTMATAIAMQLGGAESGSKSRPQ